ncbi:MAG TPA: endo-1,4-beta-xylanase, partial [Allocoleopsis sp.]
MFSTHRIARRRLLRLSLTTMAGAGLAAGIRGLYHLSQTVPSPVNLPTPPHLSSTESTRNFIGQAEGTLASKAAAKGLIYGAAANYPATSSDAEFSHLFAQECSILVPENELKWSAIRPSPDRFDFTRADW